MKLKKQIRGVITPILTPFVNKRISDEKLREFIEFQIEKKVNVIFPCGTTGEGPLMNKDMRKKVLEIVVDQVNGRIPVIAHVGAIDTKTTIELAQHAQELKVHAVASICPYYFPHDRHSIISHYNSLCEATDLPVIIYNNPGATKFNITPDMVKELFNKNENLAGVKDSSRSLEQISEIVSLSDDFVVIIGGSWLFLPALSVGADGTVSNLSNVFPEIVVNLYESFQKNDLERARVYNQKLVSLYKVLVARPPYIGNLKEALRFRGYDMGEVLSPLRSPTLDEKKELENNLKDLNLI